MKRLEAHHVFGYPLYDAMILVKNIVEIFGLKNFNQLTRPSDLQEIMTERSVDVDHATLNHWVVRYSPHIAAHPKRRNSQHLAHGVLTRPI